MLPHNVTGSVRNFINNTLQLDGAADAIEFLRRRDAPVVVDGDEWHCMGLKEFYWLRNWSESVCWRLIQNLRILFGLLSKHEEVIKDV